MFEASAKIKSEFVEKKEKLFSENYVQKNALAFSIKYSLLVEEFIRKLCGKEKFNFTLASAGSFSRRELSPYSDIDLMFITESVEENSEQISKLVTLFWDNGLEASHTVREFNDIERYINSDLHTFTQFFETRYLLGSSVIYEKWNKHIFSVLNDETTPKLLRDLIDDMSDRWDKYGDSPKVLEPNLKLSAGGLRDLQSIEWMFMLKHNILLNKQIEKTQAEIFIDEIKHFDYTTPNECRRLIDSYNLLISVRNLLHIISEQKNDRFEFLHQQKIASMFYQGDYALQQFMREYFRATNVINRFAKALIKKFNESISYTLPDSFSIDLDDSYSIKGKTISSVKNEGLTFSDILRACYYRGLHGAHFDEKLRSLIVEKIENDEEADADDPGSSVFFREILKLPKNVGQTLSIMNELGILAAFLPEFKDLVGFLQHGVYHCYTADEHTLITIKNVEKLEKENSSLGKIFTALKEKEILYLALIFHDIAKPVDISGHEIIGAEMAATVMYRLGYSEEEIDMVTFLVRNHLLMEQIAFRRNLNDPETLNNFTSKFTSVRELDLLYLVTFADLSAVNPAVWTSWKSDLLAELYRKAKAMLEEQMSGEELLISSTYIAHKEISKHSKNISESHVQEHFDSINDIAYASQFSEKEIARHIEEIRKGNIISVLFNELNDFTNITVITKDFPSLLSRLCGVLSINDANIHDAKIFTRKDGIVIDTFNVTEFRTHKMIDKDRYARIEQDFESVVTGMLQLNQEFTKMKSRWWRIESKFFKRTGKVKIVFEKHEKYTIIDVFSPDRLGFLYQVTNKMNELGLIIYFAKISTKGDDIVDSFYVLDRKGKKISPNDYQFIIAELTETISQML
ncbi:MAG: HD domain-containing protein [Ignavibacteriales bacterium]|nr:MAG: HD domain-containing protein [Ignavibacteriales bacterium]